MKFANKAGLFAVAAGISFQVGAMQDGRQLEGQWNEQASQRPVCEKPFITYNQTRCTDLGCTTTIITETYGQKVVTTITEKKIQNDQRRLDRQRIEQEFPREKLAICNETPELQWTDCDQTGQLQQSACVHKREGLYKGSPIEEKYVLADAQEVVEEYFNQDTQTLVTVSKKIYEKRSNDRHVSEVPANKEGVWVDVACGKADPCDITSKCDSSPCDSAQQGSHRNRRSKK